MSEDVTIQVASKTNLIEKTIESLNGCKTPLFISIIQLAPLKKSSFQKIKRR